ncbi:exopolysaccharide biosynthesis polyprenyl glycosylphosphotransferase [Acetobacter sp. TBRC 12305]|uniref:Exopolysaccharide biosynthesis polyprenyl glycosylphosphotransferase n=1 Tax=Acetobacter garciniae TaxID=2817435 RepID=A0A939HLT9_9PROT|nr:exopolysaccharide biosynthesis polyprenyl glycosylphosphotransferase [Acetobacter garciniae]MBO1325140.1 exopolysaccharide biosynthesis polyprenyl glycosylphosphotransferase [Acetobacter garciniae]MBX0344889.1 exopolysaccharide biosynthesis polyprenyl glycosylphosphotransferase [Acetobacter garciniae]
MGAQVSQAAVGPTTTTLSYDGAPLRDGDDIAFPAKQLWHIHLSCVTGLVAADCIAAILSMGAEGTVLQANIHDIERGVFTYSVLFLFMIGYFLYQRHYTDRPPFWQESAQVIGAAMVAACVFAGLNWPAPPTLAALMPFILFPIIDLTLRQATKRFLHRFGLWRIPVLLAGEPEACARAIEIFSSERFPGLRSAGCVSSSRLLGMSAEALRGMLVARQGAARLLLVIDSHDYHGQAVIEHIARTRVPFSLMPPLGGLPLDHGCQSYFSHDGMVMSFRSKLDRPLYQGAKIALDLFAASLILLAILPVLAIVYILVRLDGGPAVFGHMRVGRNGRAFRCLKFRTMAVDADAALAELLANDATAAAEWAATRKLTSDPRVTPIGRVLRKTSLDELPQVFNVLRLEMSLVGPRPIVAAEEVHYGKDMAYYTATRPGITGLWQVSGRSDTSYVRRVQLDNWYVRNWSLWRDIVILVKTVPAVLAQKGAR